MTYDQLSTALTKLVSTARDMDTAYAVRNLTGVSQTEEKTEDYLRIRNSILAAFEAREVSQSSGLQGEP